MALRASQERSRDLRLLTLLERFPWLADVALSALATQGIHSRRFEADENLARLPRTQSRRLSSSASGFACRYNMFPNGQRQIIGFVLPGDLCDSRATMFEHVDYSVSAIDRKSTRCSSRPIRRSIA